VNTIKDLLSSTPIDKTDARILLAHLLEQYLGWPRSALISRDQEHLPESLISQWRTLEERRLQGQPVSYLIGKKGFHGIELAVSPAVLIPRPETELLVDFAIEEIRRRLAHSHESLELKVLDLGTGSGAIALALAHALRDSHQNTLKIEVVGIDASNDAIALARENARALDLHTWVQFMQSDWYAGLPREWLGSFDLILSNPPYIDPRDPHLQAGDLRFEPRKALTDEHDGLQCIRLILDQCQDFLKGDGLIALEHGYDQAEPVCALMNQEGLSAVASRADLAGHMRISIGHKAPKTPITK
jgi:release factor glutamine methyltransferase